MLLLRSSILIASTFVNPGVGEGGRHELNGFCDILLIPFYVLSPVMTAASKFKNPFYILRRSITIFILLVALKKSN